MALVLKKDDLNLLGDGHGDVIHRQSPLSEQIFAHVCEGGR